MDQETYDRPPRPGVGRLDTSADRSHEIIEDMDPIPGDPDLEQPDIPLPKSTADEGKGGKLSKLGGRFKGVFSRGKKGSDLPSKQDLGEGTPSVSKTSTPVADTGSHTNLLKESKKDDGGGRLDKMKGRMKNIFSRGKKGEGGAPPPPTSEVTSDTEGAPPTPPFDTSKNMSVAPFSAKSQPHDKSTTLESIKAFVKGPPKQDDTPIWKKKKPKPLCRSSNVLNVLLVLLIIAGIIMTALNSYSPILRVIGPLCIGLSVLALCGKIFFTLYFQDDPFPRLRPVMERMQNKLDQKMGHAPPTRPPPSVTDVGRVNVSATPDVIQMREFNPKGGMNIADEALRTSTPTLQMDRSRTPDDPYTAHSNYDPRPEYPRSRTPDLEDRYAPPSYDHKPDISGLKARYI